MSTDYVIANRYDDRLTYFRDAAGRFWTGEFGLERAKRYTTLEEARRWVQLAFPSQRKRLCVVSVPKAAEMLVPNLCPSDAVRTTP